MTFLNAVISIRDWRLLNWKDQVDDIWRTAMTQKSDNNIDHYIKTVLSWVVICRILIAHLYTVTYISNFYAILTWGHGKILLPWLILSAFKNFVLEIVVMLVVLYLYLEDNISGYLVASVAVDKAVSLAVATHNWHVIKLLYVELSTPEDSGALRIDYEGPCESENVLMGMSMQSFDPADSFFHGRERFMSVPNLETAFRGESSEDSDELRLSQTLSTVSIIDSRDLLEKNESALGIDLSTVPTVEKVMSILGLTEDDVKRSLSDVKTPEKETATQLDDSEEEFEEGGSEISACHCPKSGFEALQSDRSLESQEISRKSSCSDLTGAFDADWMTQWSLDRIWGTQRYDSRALIQQISHSVSRWSSEEELEIHSSPNEPKNQAITVDKSFSSFFLPDISFVQPKTLCQSDSLRKPWVEHLQIAGGSFESTLQCRKLSCAVSKASVSVGNTVYQPQSSVKVGRSWILDGMSIELVNSDTDTESDHLEDVKTPLECETGGKILLNQLTQTENVDLSIAESIKNNSQDNFKNTLHEIHVVHEIMQKNPRDIYNSYYRRLALDSFRKKKPRKSLEERETKILEILRNYNKNLEDISWEKTPEFNTTEKNRRRMTDRKKLMRNDVKKTTGSLNFYPNPGPKDMGKDDSNIPAVFPEINDDCEGNLRDEIRNIDWSTLTENFPSCSSVTTRQEPATLEIIDDSDTTNCLLSAFSSNRSATTFALYLGPPANDLYSLTEQIPDVLREIGKATRLIVRQNDVNCTPSTEIDFGEAYYRSLDSFGAKHSCIVDSRSSGEYGNHLAAHTSIGESECI